MKILSPVKSHKTETRLKQVKAMHELITQTNDEGLYMTWILVMPDEPTENDFIDIAEDEQQFNDCYKLFVTLIQDKGYL